MEIGWFERVIRVNLGHGDKVRRVANAVEATECLLYQWPVRQGRELRRARMACLSVLNGEKAARYAEHAFVEAAREARILRGITRNTDVHTAAREPA